MKNSILAIALLTISTTAISDEIVSFKGTSHKELESIYQGAASVFTAVGKRNYFKRKKFDFEELTVLNFTSVMEPINRFTADIKSFELFKKGALQASIVMAGEDKLGSYREYCLKAGAKLSLKDIEDAANKYAKGEFPIKDGLVFVLMGVREALGEQYPCK
jgi:hypothetical protein